MRVFSRNQLGPAVGLSARFSSRLAAALAEMN